jgi:alpha-L-fucosidase
MKELHIPALLLSCLLSCAHSTGCAQEQDPTGLQIDSLRAREIADLKFGMFICWSFSTFSGQEWTPTLDKDASYFKATGCDTDQWCRKAREAGMGYILFLSKHHDGFCLWDTRTTDKKVTNSPLGIDVLAQLRKSCDKYGLRLALYFSEGDWNWPGAVDGKGHAQGSGANPDMKRAQLQELCTRYGPIEFFWMDHAVGDGGLGHRETVEWVHRFQPGCFVGFNHGEPAGRLSLREMGKAGPVGMPVPPGTTRKPSPTTRDTWWPNSPIPYCHPTKAGPCGSIPCPNTIPCVTRPRSCTAITWMR